MSSLKRWLREHKQRENRRGDAGDAKPSGAPAADASLGTLPSRVYQRADVSAGSMSPLYDGPACPMPQRFLSPRDDSAGPLPTAGTPADRFPVVDQRRLSGTRPATTQPAAAFEANPDSYPTLPEVQAALRAEGLESSSLVVAVDCTVSNCTAGSRSYPGHKNLHALRSDGSLNPYEEVMTVIGRTLADFDDDQLVPLYGFGDASASGDAVFSFFPDSGCAHGLPALLARYREAIPHISLAGPTSFAPAIRQAMRQVVASGMQYHILLMLVDGQVTRSVDTPPGRLSPQEQATADAIVEAANLPLSIVIIGIGDGPWDTMQEFDDALPQRRWDNTQFVNFTEIERQNAHLTREQREGLFAVAALQEIPAQYKAIRNFGLLGAPPPQNLSTELPPLPPPARVLAADAQRAAAPPPAVQPMAPPAVQPIAPPAVQPIAPPAVPSTVGPSAPPAEAVPAAPSVPMPTPFAHPSAVPGPHPSAPPAAASSAKTSITRSLSETDGFCCPISGECMVDPVIAADGHSYERAQIEEWFSKSSLSPCTGSVITNKNLVPNINLRKAIQQAREAEGAGV